MNKPRNQFTFYRSYYDAIQELSKRDQSALILAVCAYAIYETPPKCLSNAASTAFKLIQPTLDAGRKKAENGSMKGKAYDKQTESKTEAKKSKTEANCKQGETASKKEVEIEKEIEYEEEVEVDVEGEDPEETAAATAERQKLKAVGGKLGKGVVFLSDEQFDDLLDRIGLDAFDYYVERLATFIIEKDAHVQNHYGMILKWHEEDTAIKNRSKQTW